MEEQNRKDPGGLKKHGDPIGSDAGSAEQTGRSGQAGAGGAFGARPGEPGRSGSSLGGGGGLGGGTVGAGGRTGGAATTGGVGGTNVPGRPGNPPQWTGQQRSGLDKPGSGRGQGGSMSGEGGMSSSRLGETMGEATAVVDRLRSNAERVAEKGICRLADEIRSIGSASHAAVDRLNDEKHGEAGKYVDDVVRRFEGAADYLEREGLDGIVRDASDLARRNPALFLGAAALVGFVVGRVISARPPRGGSSGGYGGGRDESYGRERSLFEQRGSFEERRTT